MTRIREEEEDYVTKPNLVHIHPLEASRQIGKI